jgi:hypothetical protein
MPSMTLTTSLQMAASAASCSSSSGKRHRARTPPPPRLRSSGCVCAHNEKRGGREPGRKKTRKRLPVPVALPHPPAPFAEG